MNQTVDIPDLRGTWRRSLLQTEDGRRDTTTNVRWLQGVTAYGDLRQPPSVAGVTARSLRCLTQADASVLARQEAFGGQLVRHTDHFEWTRLIDYQPNCERGDRGTLEWRGGVLIEQGYEHPYIEHWHRDEGCTGPASALRLAERDTGVTAFLVRVGSQFAFLRNRGAELAMNRSLSDLVSEANTLEGMQDLVDCEISLGSVDDWLIERSSLPWRIGMSLGLQRTAVGLLTEDVDANGNPKQRVWAIVEEEA